MVSILNTYLEDIECQSAKTHIIQHVKTANNRNMLNLFDFIKDKIKKMELNYTKHQEISKL